MSSSTTTTSSSSLDTSRKRKYQMIEQHDNSNNNDNVFSCLNEDLTLCVASFLVANDLLTLQSVSVACSKLPTQDIWKQLCIKRWEYWPRYNISTPERYEKFCREEEDATNSTWQQRYQRIYYEATRMELQQEDLYNRCWYLCFNFTGMREDSRTPFGRVHFTPWGALLVPGYPPLPYEIVNEAPPTPPTHIRRQSLRGDRPFSESQYLRVSNFPHHYITKKLCDAEWLIVNQNVTMISSSSQRQDDDDDGGDDSDDSD